MLCKDITFLNYFCAKFIHSSIFYHFFITFVSKSLSLLPIFLRTNNSVSDMNKIIEKQHFSQNVVKLVVEAPLIARSRRPGHFVIVIADEKGERIPGSGSWTLFAGTGQPDARTAELTGKKSVAAELR